MIISVQHKNKPGIANSSKATLLNGDNNALLIWEQTPGYTPIQVEYFTQWQAYTDIFGQNMYACYSINH